MVAQKFISRVNFTQKYNLFMAICRTESVMDMW